MAFFNEFKDMFNKAAQSVTSKTKDGVEITRLAGESRSLNNEISILYNEIGRVYVESKGQDSEALASLCARAEDVKRRLDDVERQKQQLRNQNRCPECGAITSKDARFCSSCGYRIPEPAAAPAPVAKEVVCCPECGAAQEPDALFCTVCGYSYKSKEQASEPIPEPTIITRPIVIQPEVKPEETPSETEAD